MMMMMMRIRSIYTTTTATTAKRWIGSSGGSISGAFSWSSSPHARAISSIVTTAVPSSSSSSPPLMSSERPIHQQRLQQQQSHFHPHDHDDRNKGRLRLRLHHQKRRWISSDRITKNLLTSEESSTNFDRSPSKQDLVFGKTFTDHMLTMEWSRDTSTSKDGGSSSSSSSSSSPSSCWSDPRIVPYDDLRISPAASCLHYGLQCFEGMKAYRSLVDPTKIHLFRPDMNMKRLENSMKRLSMLEGVDAATPNGQLFDHQQLIKCIGELCKVDEKWIPSGEGYSLYLRPTVIATHRHLGVCPPDDLLLYVIASPVGPYYKSGFKPIRLLADPTYVRAWPGGTGDAKVGGNYAPTIKPAAEASTKGYSQILWLYGPNDEVTEVGAMNVFFYLQNKDTGRNELVTAPLTRGDILPGVTRASILDLARSGRLNSDTDDQDFDVSERFITMGEVVEASNDGRLLEVFGAGTAAVVTPVDCIHYLGHDINIPATGSLTQRVWDELIGIQYRTKEAPPGW
eukprot:CAMPEP_0113483832 /NCGR_PEP_ID=MMETSP0014_2-20120614/23641_1 /TAXON_ID=2857 /ORGANISM="Nitzschia sp." /LENGTH=511 /DNA_ID=CAMNT_0000377399 /DNA_START=190 /DNA_END=1722 /DNA_ORIENTATION=+ /assembly_acc=CAM_ASM_000159